MLILLTKRIIKYFNCEFINQSGSFVLNVFFIIFIN